MYGGKTLTALIAFAATLIGGCTSLSGVAEFRIYAESVDALATATEPLTERLRVAERRNGRRQIDRGQVVAGVAADVVVQGLATSFKVEHAPYLAQTGYPPFAAAVRSAVYSLKRFSDAALIYAEGRALDDARADLGGLIGNVTAGLGALSGGGTFALGPIATAFVEGTTGAAEFGSRDAFRGLLKEEAGRLDALLKGLVASAPQAFELLTLESFEARGDAIIDDPGGARATDLSDSIRADRELVAEWVLLVELSRTLLGDTLVAIDRPSTVSERIASANQISARIQDKLARIRVLLAGG